MSENRKFIDLTEVFYESVKIGEEPRTWWQKMNGDLGEKYERQPRTKAVAVPVDSIAKIEECDYSGGVKAALIMKSGEPIYTQDDKATLLAKIAPAPKPAQ